MAPEMRAITCAAVAHDQGVVWGPDVERCVWRIAERPPHEATDPAVRRRLAMQIGGPKLPGAAPRLALKAELRRKRESCRRKPGVPERHLRANSEQKAPDVLAPCGVAC